MARHWRRGGRALVLAAGMLACFAAPGLAEVRLVPGMGLNLTYTDNVAGAPLGQEDDDIFTTLTPSLSLTVNSGRGQANFRYGLSYDKYRNSDEMDNESHNLLGSGRFEVWRQRVFLDVQAAMSRQIINRNGAIAADNRNLDSNQTEVFNYQVGLTRTFRHKDWLVSDSRLSLSQTINDPLGNNSGGNNSGGNNLGAAATSSNTTTYSSSQVLSSGARFTQLTWSLTTSYEENIIEDGDEVTDLVGRVDSEYAFNRFFAGIVTAGYEKVDAGNRDDSSSNVTWTVGGRFTPGPRTLLRIEHGSRFDGSYNSGDFSYQISPTMAVVASYRQDVAIQQTTVNNAFANLTTDDAGNFIDGATGLPFSQTSAGSDLSEGNNVNRTRTFNVALSGSRARNTYGGAFSWNQSRTRSQSRRQTTKSANFNFGRQLSPRSNLSISAGLTDTNDNTAANSTTLNVSANLDYQIATSVVGSAAVTHLRRDSPDPAAELEENTLSARLQLTF